MAKVPDSPRIVWILGGTGFIGRSLVDHLSKDPSNKIHLLVHKNIPFRNLERFNTVTGSLDRFDLAWFDRYPPDVVFHLARMAGPGPWRRKLASLRGERANERLSKYFRSLVKPPVVVYVSGSLMYGDQPDGIPVDEFAPLNPVAFGREYIRAERPWMSNAGDSGLKVHLVRPGWIVGPGSWFRVFFWDHYVKTGRVPVYGDGKQMMSPVHVDDLGARIAKVPEMGPDILNLFAGKPVSQLDFAGIMAGILGAPVENIPLTRISREFGKAEAEALGASIPLTTRYYESWNGHSLKYPGAEDMLTQTIGILKGEKSVFSKPPTWGPV